MYQTIQTFIVIHHTTNMVSVFVNMGVDDVYARHINSSKYLQVHIVPSIKKMQVWHEYQKFSNILRNWLPSFALLNPPRKKIPIFFSFTLVSTNLLHYYSLIPLPTHPWVINTSISTQQSGFHLCSMQRAKGFLR